MQPAEPIDAGDDEEVPIGPVDHARAGTEQPLFAQRVAEMPGHAGVAAGGGNGKVSRHRVNLIALSAAFVPLRSSGSGRTR